MTDITTTTNDRFSGLGEVTDLVEVDDIHEVGVDSERFFQNSVSAGRPVLNAENMAVVVVGDDMPAGQRESGISGFDTAWQVEGVENTDRGTTLDLRQVGTSGRVRLLNPDQRGGEATEGSHVVGIERILWKRIGLLNDIYVRFEPDLDQSPIGTDAWVPILRCHCPAHQSCKATLTSSTAITNGVKGSIAFMGLKAEKGYEVAFTFKRSLDADDVGCMEIVRPAKVLVAFGRTMVNDTTVGFGYDVQILPQEGVTRVRRIPEHMDACRGAAPQPEQWLSDEATAVDDGALPSTSSWTLGTVGQGAFGLEVDLGSTPLKLSVAYERSMDRELDLAVTLAPGAEYRPFIETAGVGHDPTAIAWHVVT